jgi:hypothetical protein
VDRPAVTPGVIGDPGDERLDSPRVSHSDNRKFRRTKHFLYWTMTLN